MSFRIGAPHFIFGTLIGIGLASNQVPTEAKVALAAGTVFCQLLYQCWCKKPSIKEQLYTALENRNWADLSRLIPKMPPSLLETYGRNLICMVMGENAQVVKEILQRLTLKTLRSDAPILIRKFARSERIDQPEQIISMLIDKLPADTDPRIWFEKSDHSPETVIETIIRKFPQDQQAVIAEAIYSKIPSDFFADRSLAALHIAILRKQEQIVTDCILQLEPQHLESRGEDLFRVLRNNNMLSQSVALALVERMPASMCKRAMAPLVALLPQEQKLEAIDTLFRKMPPEDLRSLGISLELFQRLRSGENVPGLEISQFIDNLDPAIWVTRNGLYTALGIAIALCSHIKKYEAVVLEVIKKLNNEQLASNCIFFEGGSIFFGRSSQLNPLEYAALCNANEVFLSILKRFSDIPTDSLNLHITLSSKEEPLKFFKRRNFLGKTFSSEEYQQQALTLIPHLPFIHLESSLFNALYQEQNEIAKAMIQRGVPHEVIPDEANWNQEIHRRYKRSASDKIYWNVITDIIAISRQKFLELTTSGNIAERIKLREMGRK
jgi:hypothetical protein